MKHYHKDLIARIDHFSWSRSKVKKVRHMYSKIKRTPCAYLNLLVGKKQETK